MVRDLFDGILKLVLFAFAILGAMALGVSICDRVISKYLPKTAETLSKELNEMKQ